jgi:hypothetical protein
MRVRTFILATALIGGASCTNKPPEPRELSVQPGKYTVCDTGDTAAHGDSEGVHVDKGDLVEIGKIEAETATQVCLRGVCSDAQNANVKTLWMMVNGERLAAVNDFGHTKDGQPIQELHLVRLTKADTSQFSAELKAQCAKNNVLQLQFCPLNAGGTGFECGPELPHQGGAHIEN